MEIKTLVHVQIPGRGQVKPGRIIDVTEARAAELIGLHYAELVITSVKPAPPETADKINTPETAVKKRRTKKHKR